MFIFLSGYSDLSDADLIKKIQAGNSLAFKAIYFRYHDRIYSFLCSKTRTDIAQDLAQDVFCKLWEKRQSISDQSQLKAYLFTIALNGFRDHIKKKSTSELSTDSVSFDKSENEHSSLIQDIHYSIQEMPDKIQTVFILSRFEGYKYQEIADILDVSIKTVESYLSKALSHLRKQLIFK